MKSDYSEGSAGPYSLRMMAFVAAMILFLIAYLVIQEMGSHEITQITGVAGLISQLLATVLLTVLAARLVLSRDMERPSLLVGYCVAALICGLIVSPGWGMAVGLGLVGAGIALAIAWNRSGRAGQ